MSVRIHYELHRSSIIDETLAAGFAYHKGHRIDYYRGRPCELSVGFSGRAIGKADPPDFLRDQFHGATRVFHAVLQTSQHICITTIRDQDADDGTSQITLLSRPFDNAQRG